MIRTWLLLALGFSRRFCLRFEDARAYAYEYTDDSACEYAYPYTLSVILPMLTSMILQMIMRIILIHARLCDDHACDSSYDYA